MSRARALGALESQIMALPPPALAVAIVAAVDALGEMGSEGGALVRHALQEALQMDGAPYVEHGIAVLRDALEGLA